jgi:hypothetical protein
LQRARPARELLLAVVFLALWILPPFWQIATLRAVNVQDDIFASDLWNDRLPARAFIGASLKRGDSVAWMPGIYTGFPSLAQVEIGALYPTNLLLFGLFSPYAAIAWAQILPLAIAGIGTFCLAGELGLPLVAKLFAAGVFALSGFLVVHLRQLNMVDAAAWIPFLFLFVERIASGRRGRSPLWLALVWLLQLLAGHPQVSYFTALVLSGYFLARRWQERSNVAWPFGHALGGVVLPLAIGTLAAAVVLIPAAELSRLTYRQAGLGFDEATRYAVSPLSLWTFFSPSLFGDARDDSFRLPGLFWEQYGYAGVLPALSTIVAIVVCRRNRYVRLFAGIAVVSFLLVLGKNTPVFGWAFAAVPGMRYFRFPTRFLVFVDLAIALLGAFGVAACLEALGAARRSLVAAAVIGVTAADLWIHLARQVPQVEWQRWLSPIGTERILAEARRSNPEPWRYYTLDASFVHGETYHAAHGWSGDLAPYVALRALLQPSFNLLFDLESPDGYANLVPREYEAIWGSEKKLGIRSIRHLETGELEPEVARMLRLFNVRYLLSPMVLRSEAFSATARSAEGMNVYEIAAPLARGFVVGETIRVASSEEALGRMTGADFDPARQAIVEGGGVELPAGAAPSTNVRVVGRSNAELALRASLDRPGLLVVSEGYYPGWQATVDGAAAPIFRVNVMMRGVILAAGEHEIVFRFRSPSVAAGAIVSALAIALLIVAHRRFTLPAISP